MLKTVKSKLEQLIEEINYRYCPDMKRKLFIAIYEKTMEFDSNSLSQSNLKKYLILSFFIEIEDVAREPANGRENILCLRSYNINLWYGGRRTVLLLKRTGLFWGEQSLVWGISL